MGLSSLPRTWHDLASDAFVSDYTASRSPGDGSEIINKNESEFTLLQFNLLAEGLCAGDGGRRELAYPDPVAQGAEVSISNSNSNSKGASPGGVQKERKLFAHAGSGWGGEGEQVQDKVSASSKAEAKECGTPFRHSNCGKAGYNDFGNFANFGVPFDRRKYGLVFEL